MPPLRFSANLGFLWADLALPEAIRAAHRAGFDAVECHWPYATPPGAVAAALAETGLPMLALNTAPGDRARGEFGLAALPGREAEALEATRAALDYAQAIGAGQVHVMAGNAKGGATEACFRAHLAAASAMAAPRGITLLIEPLNAHDAPGYFLRDTAQAMALLDGLALPNVKLMFDCYHVARTEGAVIPRLRECLAQIGHIQLASVPERGPLDGGNLDYSDIFAEIARIGWDRPLGVEYRPPGPVEDSLGWMNRLRRPAPRA